MDRWTWSAAVLGRSSALMTDSFRFYRRLGNSGVAAPGTGAPRSQFETSF